MDFEVVPSQGVGPVRLGMTRAESRAAMAGEPEPFLKGGEGPPVDGYFGASFQVFFDDADTVEFIELSASEKFRALFAGEAVLEMDADEAVELVSREASVDEDDHELGYRFLFPALSLALWRPVLPDDDEDPDGRTFSTVAVGRPGAWDD